MLTAGSVAKQSLVNYAYQTAPRKRTFSKSGSSDIQRPDTVPSPKQEFMWYVMPNLLTIGSRALMYATYPNIKEVIMLEDDKFSYPWEEQCHKTPVFAVYMTFTSAVIHLEKEC